MKNILLFTLLILQSSFIFSQNFSLINSTNFEKFDEPTKLNYSTLKQQSFQNAILLDPLSFTIDYSFYDILTYDDFNGAAFRIHEDFTETDLVTFTNELGNFDTLIYKFKYAGVAFAWYNNSYNVDMYNNADSLTYNYENYATTIDSVFFTFRHVNNSGLQQQLRTRIFLLDDVLASNNQEFDLTPTPIFTHLQTTDTSLTAINGLDINAIPVDITLPQLGDRFVIVVDILGGDKLIDEFYIVNTFGQTASCLNNDAEVAKFSPNSFYDLQFSDVFSFSSLNGPQNANAVFLDNDGNGIFTPNNCEAFITQNWNIWAAVTIDSTFSITSQTSENIICQGDEINLTALTFAGEAPYNYSWFPNAEIISQNENTAIAAPTTSTNFEVTVTDANGNVLTDEVFVEVNEIEGSFTFVQNDLTVNFFGNTLNPNNITWNFGDNYSSSNNDTVTHIYNQAGNYTIEFTTANLDETCEITISETITVGTVNIKEFYFDNLNIYHSAAQQKLFINLQSIQNKAVELNILNANGQIIKTAKVPNGNFNNYFETSNFNCGIYFVHVIIDGKSIVKKVMVN